MPIPNQGTREWNEEIDFYRNCSSNQLKERAKQLRLKESSYRRGMLAKGILRGKTKSKIKVFDVPEISVTPEPVIVNLPDIKITPLALEHDDKNEGEEVFVSMISDIHGGLKTSTYNPDVFVERLNIYKKFIINIALEHRKMRPIRKLVIPMLGDIVQGQQIGTQMLVEEAGIIGAEKQIYDLLLPNITEFVINLLQIFETIEIYGVEGNHGNINKRRETLTKQSNWDTIFYRSLAMALSKQDRVKVEPEVDTWWKVVNINNWNFFLTHLDKIMSYHGVPWYGLSARGSNWKQSMSLKDVHFDYILGGHFHTPNYLHNNGVPVLINGTFVSDSDFPLSRMGLMDVPQQVAFFVSKKYGITAQYRVKLDERRRE